MTAFYCWLGPHDLSDKIYGGIKFKGGTWRFKQDGATSLVTGARLDTAGPDGSLVNFEVIFDSRDPTQAVAAQDFLTYCYSNAYGQDIAFYGRTADYYLRVWGIQIIPHTIGASDSEAMDYPLLRYDVTLILWGPIGYSTADPNVTQLWI